MSPTASQGPHESWKLASRLELDAAIEDAARRIERLVRGIAPMEEIAEAKTPPKGALGAIASAFELRPFERQVLALAAGAELRADVAALCAKAQGDAAKPYPTFGLAVAAFDAPHWDALAPQAALRQWRLIAMDGEGRPRQTGFMLDKLGVPEAVLHFLLGNGALDPALAAALTFVAPAEEPVAGQDRLAGELAMALTPEDPEEELAAIALDGPVEAALDVACLALAKRNLSLFKTDIAAIPTEAAALDEFCRLWRRDALLLQAGLAVVSAKALPGSGEFLARLAERVGGAVFFLGGEYPAQANCTRPLLRYELPPTPVRDREALWKRALGSEANIPQERIARLSEQFDLGWRATRACARAALSAGGGKDRGAYLWQLARMRARSRLGDIARRVDSKAMLGDLLVPEIVRQALSLIVEHHRRRHAVTRIFGAGGRGAGLATLFAGPSGVGKTMAAEAIANALELDLYRIDLSGVVDKYIGETEKNLRRVFEAAEASGAVLLFDEADALFGRRSEVRDSHDRYANIEVSYLLQRMENYDGIAILTTNMYDAIDRAFLRRLDYIVHFPFPDAADRASLWRQYLPSEGALDYARLAQPALSGGQIRKVAANAKVLALAAGNSVSMADVRRAVVTEYAKLQRVPSAAEMEGWA